MGISGFDGAWAFDYLRSMPATTIRISPKGQRLLGELARECGASTTEVLEAALESYRRQRFVQGANADMARLRRDKKAWVAFQAELTEWDVTLGDGLENVK